MVIGTEQLKKMVKKGLVSHLSRRELENPEGPGLDLRAGEFFAINGNGFLGVTERQTPSATSIAKYKQENSIIIKPGEYYLVATVEELQMPENVFAHIYPRSTLFRSGISLLAGKVSPGYQGRLVFGFANLGLSEFRVELGARIAFIVFHEILGRSSLSRGQWKGGRITAEKKEQQI